MANAENITKKVPTRRCTGCGEHFPKNTLIRVLRTPDGEIILDLTGKKSGRGAYICKKAQCLKKAQILIKIIFITSRICHSGSAKIF